MSEESSVLSSANEVVRNTSKKVSEATSSLLDNVKSLFSGSKGLWVLACVLLVGTIVYYLYSKNKQRVEEENVEMEHVEQELNVPEPLNSKELKLPKQYLADENGHPVILTPEIVQQIKNQNMQSQQTSENHVQEHELPELKEENETLSDESEDENVTNQDLTTDEMANIREQLEMMNSTSVMPVNS